MSGSDAVVCREGINFALSLPEGHTVTVGAAPPYVDFLSVLGEFSNRLLEVDKTGKKGVLVYLQVSSIDVHVSFNGSVHKLGKAE